mmetsp:Transcript_840/g.1426  ORF Transcript_840/g.1426 Transcript_840/m.1426 type:complete len:132 (-) Transcript_840:136-531(-)
MEEESLQMALQLSKQEIDRTPGVIRMPGMNERNHNSNSHNYSTNNNNSGSSSHDIQQPTTVHTQRQSNLLGRWFQRQTNTSSNTSTSHSNISHDPVSTLVNMGFTPDQVTRALRESNNDINLAAGVLLGHV